MDLIVDIFLKNTIGQTVGVIAFLVSVYNFLFCKDKKFILFTLIVSFIWAIHFYLIGLLAAAMINLVDVFKNALALKYERSKRIAGIFILFYIIVGYFTFEGYISLIPTLNAIISTYLVFYVRGVKLNIGFLGVVILWGIYNFTGNSIGGISTDITLFFVGIIGIVRIIINDRKAALNKEKEVISS